MRIAPVNITTPKFGFKSAAPKKQQEEYSNYGGGEVIKQSDIKDEGNTKTVVEYSYCGGGDFFPVVKKVPVEKEVQETKTAEVPERKVLTRMVPDGTYTNNGAGEVIPRYTEVPVTRTVKVPHYMGGGDFYITEEEVPVYEDEVSNAQHFNKF